MVLPAPLALPPMVLDDAPVARATPATPLGKGVVPLATSVPMRLPWTRLPVVPLPPIRTPYWLLPAMTFAEPLAVPPMVLLAAPFRMATPSLAFGKPEGRGLWDVAGTLVTPMLFPWIRLLLVPGSLRRMPKRPLPDRTLPAPLAVPPMVLLDAPPKTAMPSAALGTVVLPL